MRRTCVWMVSGALVFVLVPAMPAIVVAQGPSAGGPFEYRVLATSRTSTMEKELNAAANMGFKFSSVMGGETAVGGQEVVVILGRTENSKPRYQYRLLATSRTSTMQRELQQAADEGFQYIGQTVFETAFGGQEVVCILERDKLDSKPNRYQYRLFATTRTSTMERELTVAGNEGFEVLGMTIGKTAIGGKELVTITRREAR